MRHFLKQHLPPRPLLHVLAWKNYFFGEPEFRVLRKIVDPKRKAIDIGANRGLYTYFLARMVPKVYAYEPNPRMVEFLRISVRSNVDVINLALSDEVGEALLNIPLRSGEEIDGWASLSKDFTNGSCRQVVVRMARLDQQGHSGIGFIKIDVEGHEERVIDGASGLIRTDRPMLLVEIEQRHIAKPIQEVFDKILDFGYEGFFLRGGTLRPLAEFSVQADQTSLLPALEAGAGGVTYVNNFVFAPRPGNSGAGLSCA